MMRLIALMITLSKRQLQALCADGKSTVNIVGATLIRKKLSHIIDVFPVEKAE